MGGTGRIGSETVVVQGHWNIRHGAEAWGVVGKKKIKLKTCKEVCGGVVANVCKLIRNVRVEFGKNNVSAGTLGDFPEGTETI